MPNITSILNSAVGKTDRINVLTFTTHERYQSAWSKVKANFFLWNDEKSKPWVHKYAPMPENHILLPFHPSTPAIPVGVDINLVITHHLSQYDRALQAATHLNVPLLRLEHCLPDEVWSPEQRKFLITKKGDVNIFITQHQLNSWGGDENDSVIYNAIDTTLFAPREGSQREPVCLSVVNDWVKRDNVCGFSFWKLASKDLPVKVLGDTPGLSKAAANVGELAAAYRDSLIFLCTATNSSLPTTVLEAMSSGCCVIAYRATAIEEAIEHGVDGFLVDSPEQMNALAKRLLTNPAYCEAIGKKAREKALDRHNLDVFVEKWNQALCLAVNAPWWRKQWLDYA